MLFTFDGICSAIKNNNVYELKKIEHNMDLCYYYFYIACDIKKFDMLEWLLQNDTFYALQIILYCIEKTNFDVLTFLQKINASHVKYSITRMMINIKENPLLHLLQWTKNLKIEHKYRLHFISLSIKNLYVKVLKNIFNNSKIILNKKIIIHFLKDYPYDTKRLFLFDFKTKNKYFKGYNKAGKYKFKKINFKKS